MESSPHCYHIVQTLAYILQVRRFMKRALAVQNPGSRRQTGGMWQYRYARGAHIMPLSVKWCRVELYCGVLYSVIYTTTQKDQPVSRRTRQYRRHKTSLIFLISHHTLQKHSFPVAFVLRAEGVVVLVVPKAEHDAALTIQTRRCALEVVSIVQ